MRDHIVRLSGGPEHYGGEVPPALLAPVLQSIGPLAEKSLRMNIVGRSSGGRAPKWIKRASDVRFVDIAGDRGDTLLGFKMPLLGAAAEDIFKQDAFPFFERLDPNETALNLVGLMLDDVARDNADSARFDQSLLKTVGKLSTPLKSWGDLWFEGAARGKERHGHVTEESCRIAQKWIATAPAPRTVRVTGTMDMMRVSKSKFALILKDETEVCGVFEKGELKDYGDILGQRVMVTGRLIYKPSGKPLRIEAQHIEASEDSNTIWEKLPKGYARKVGGEKLIPLVQPNRGINALVGILSDVDDDEEEIQRALEEMS